MEAWLRNNRFSWHKIKYNHWDCFPRNISNCWFNFFGVDGKFKKLNNSPFFSFVFFSKINNNFWLEVPISPPYVHYYYHAVMKNGIRNSIIRVEWDRQGWQKCALQRIITWNSQMRGGSRTLQQPRGSQYFCSLSPFLLFLYTSCDTFCIQNFCGFSQFQYCTLPKTLSFTSTSISFCNSGAKLPNTKCVFFCYIFNYYLSKTCISYGKMETCCFQSQYFETGLDYIRKVDTVVKLTKKFTFLRWMCLIETVWIQKRKKRRKHTWFSTCSLK